MQDHTAPFVWALVRPYVGDTTRMCAHTKSEQRCSGPSFSVHDDPLLWELTETLQELH